MDELGFCPQCGNVKESPSLPYCLSCFEEERTDYRKIRNFLQKNPYSNAMEIARGTDVKIERILNYIKGNTFIMKKNK